MDLLFAQNILNCDDLLTRLEDEEPRLGLSSLVWLPPPHLFWGVRAPPPVGEQKYFEIFRIIIFIFIYRRRSCQSGHHL